MAHAASYDAAIDGSVSEIHGHARYYNGISQAISDTITALRTVTNNLTTRSDAVDAFAEIAEEVRTNLAEVEDRYTIVAEQLVIYANALQGLQDRANVIQSAARNAAEDIPNKQWRHSQEQSELWVMLPDDPLRASQERFVDRLWDELQELQATVNTSDSSLDDLLDEWRGVANACADAIKAVIDGSDLNDDWGDWWSNFVTEILPVLELILDIAAIVLTVLAVLAVLTGVGAAIAPALMLLARGAQLLSKVVKVIRVLATVALVVTGKMPVTKLIDLAVDLALDKFGGDLVNKWGGKLGTAFVKNGGAQLQNLFARVGMDTAAGNMDLITRNGMADWLGDTFAKGIELDDWTIRGIELDDINVGDFNFELDEFGQGIGSADDFLGKIFDFDFNFSGPSGGPLDGFAWDATSIGLRVNGWEFTPAEMVSNWYQDSQRPSYESLVGSS